MIHEYGCNSTQNMDATRTKNLILKRELHVVRNEKKNNLRAKKSLKSGKNGKPVWCSVTIHMESYFNVFCPCCKSVPPLIITNVTIKNRFCESGKHAALTYGTYRQAVRHVTFTWLPVFHPITTRSYGYGKIRTATVRLQTDTEAVLFPIHPIT